MPRQLRVLQVSTADIAGGAEKIAMNLFRAYREMGNRSYLTVGYKSVECDGIRALDSDCYRGIRARSCRWTGRMMGRVPSRLGGRLLPYLLDWIGEPRRHRKVVNGEDDFDFPGTWHLLDRHNPKPDILHCHNLHGGYFDLRALPWLSQCLPIVLTLHDAWLLTGHCAHSFDCYRWQTGCGDCPDLSIKPTIKRDATAHNWQRKKDIFSKTRLYVATPSQWLMNKVARSMLSPSVLDSRVIPNGVDISLFSPGKREASRRVLGILEDTRMVLFAGNGIRGNIWKDYENLRAAISLLSESYSGERLIFTGLGDNGPDEKVKNVEVRFIPFEQREHIVAQYFHAADLYVHSARIDTFPSSVIEALACGVPVVATAVGGIPEQIRHGITGLLVKPADAHEMARGIENLLSDDRLREAMGKEARADACRLYDLEKQADTYLNWYEQIIERNSPTDVWGSTTNRSNPAWSSRSHDTLSCS